MKNIDIVIFTAVMILLFQSCKNGLMVNPSDQYTEDTFWENSGEAMAALTGCYRVLHDGAGTNWFYETDMITPNGYAYNEANGTDAIARGVHNTLTGLVTNRWAGAYRGIGRANTFLENVLDVPMDEQLKSRAIGEAKFLRALYYFYLVDCFGGVPLILEKPNPETQSLMPRNTKEEVVNQILIDLTEAADDLPLSYSSGSDLGRATKGAALALKSRVLLYNERWQEAAETAKEVIDLNAYSLFDNYREMFFQNNEHNVEVIFNVEYQSPRFTNSLDYQSYQLNRPAPLKDLVDSYLMIDGKTIEESPLFDVKRPFENRDPRLLQTINCIGYMFNGRITEPSHVVNTGFGLKKYTKYTDNEASTPTPQNTSEINPILIRYAEVLLTYAEAENETTGPNPLVYAAINELRKRPSVNMPAVEANLSKDEMRQVIRRERRIELAFEGIYYSDIKRWKIAETVNNQPGLNYQDKEVTMRKFDKDRDYLWPIPANQIQLNPNLEQNPNWY